MKTISFRHSGNIGDIIYSIPCVRSMIDTIQIDNPDEAVRAKWLLHTGIPAQYLPGANHPCGSVRMSPLFAQSMKELLLTQSWVDSVEIAPFFNRREIDIDLDEMRNICVSTDRGSIPDYYAWTFAVQYDNIHDPWITVETGLRPVSTETCLYRPVSTSRLYHDNNMIIVGRSKRYRSPHVNYLFLKNYENVGFLGMDDEYEDFLSVCPQAKKLVIDDSYVKAVSLIAGCRMYIGNQSFFYALAEAVKVLRLLEVSPICPNVRQYGKLAYSAIHENVMRDYFNVLLEKTERKPMIFK